MYVQKDLTLAPLLEQIGDDEDGIMQHQGTEEDDIIVGGGDNYNLVRDRIDKTFYGRIQLNSKDGKQYEGDNRPLKGEKVPKKKLNGDQLKAIHKDISAGQYDL